MDNMVKDVIAIIPARGGSKRIPQKNIIDFYNKPIIGWTIEAALKTEIFQTVYVDTDRDEIASIAIKYGAQIPFLRDNYNDDYSTVSQSSTYFLERLKKIEVNSNYVIQLMANCPLRTSESIKKAFDNFIKTDTDFQISCFKYGWMNPCWALK
jgi:N-acylneuraminate cytidylyltransferase